MNTKFFFDREEPHGRVVDSKGGTPIPTESQGRVKANSIGEKINSF